MIILPYKDVPYICQDALSVILNALFVEVKDKRLISLADPTTNSKRVCSIRESSLFEDLISLLDIFGEDDFIKAITPKLCVLVDEVSLGLSFIDAFNSNFKEIV